MADRYQIIDRGGHTFRVVDSHHTNEEGYLHFKPCVLCSCKAVDVLFGFPVCLYHLDNGENDAACPKCA